MAQILVVFFWIGLALSELHAESRVRILALGDSLTAGYRLKPDLAFVAKLSKSLNEAGYPVEIVNAGVSGDTAAQGLARLDWALKRGGPFQVAFVELGANDGLRRASVEAMRSSLDKIIEKLKREKVSVFLMGMKLPLNFDEKYRKEFEKVFPELASKHKVPLYPFVLEGVAMKAEFNLADMLHPNEKGHELIAESLEKWLLEQKEFKNLFQKK